MQIIRTNRITCTVGDKELKVRKRNNCINLPSRKSRRRTLEEKPDEALVE
jgi:hypothetical protein